jgi:diguanylate cyclase (GGDEF)-like protein
MLLVGMDSRRGADAAERLRAAVAGTVVESASARINVTISAGVTCADPEQVTDLSALIERADRALYAAKQAGRNRIVSA